MSSQLEKPVNPETKGSKTLPSLTNTQQTCRVDIKGSLKKNHLLNQTEIHFRSVRQKSGGPGWTQRCILWKEVPQDGTSDSWKLSFLTYDPIIQGI